MLDVSERPILRGVAMRGRGLSRRVTAVGRKLSKNNVEKILIYHGIIAIFAVNTPTRLRIFRKKRREKNCFLYKEIVYLHRIHH